MQGAFGCRESKGRSCSPEIRPGRETMHCRPLTPRSSQPAESHFRAIDLFCGAGGSSCGARLAGVDIVAGFDVWGLARSVYKLNFPEAFLFGGHLENRRLSSLIRDLGRVDLILASPECTSHSPAKGNRPPCENSRNTAFQVLRFARAFQPRWIVIENVVSMRKWFRFEDLVNRLGRVGYYFREQVINANTFGVPQSRRRLFLLFDYLKEPSIIFPPRTKNLSAEDVIVSNGSYSYSPLFSKRRARATIERAKRAISALGMYTPFLIVYYGSDGAGGWQPLNTPLRTITTLDRFGYVIPTKAGHMIRMLQVPELKAAMGMPKDFRIEGGTRRDRIKLLGNAVCPPVMKSVVETLIYASERRSHG
jgi:DNA (cytosine-5)-methyltransferase 1